MLATVGSRAVAAASRAASRPASQAALRAASQAALRTGLQPWTRPASQARNYNIRSTRKNPSKHISKALAQSVKGSTGLFGMLSQPSRRLNIIPESANGPHYFSGLVPMTEKEVLELGPFGPEYTIYDGDVDGIPVHEYELSRAFYQVYEAPKGEDFNDTYGDFKSLGEDGKLALKSILGTGEFTNDGRNAISVKTPKTVRKTQSALRGGVNVSELLKTYKESGKFNSCMELIHQHDKIKNYPVPTQKIQSIIKALCFDDESLLKAGITKTGVARRQFSTKDCLRTTAGSPAFIKAQTGGFASKDEFQQTGWSELMKKNIIDTSQYYNTYSELQESVKENYVRNRILVHSVILHALFAAYLSDKIDTINLLYEYFAVPKELQVDMKKEIKLLDSLEWPEDVRILRYDIFECNPYIKSHSAEKGDEYGNIISTKICPNLGKIVAHIFGKFMNEERPSIFVRKNPSTVRTEITTPLNRITEISKDIIAVRHDTPNNNITTLIPGSSCKIGSDIIKETQYLYMHKDVHPYLQTNDHTKFAVMAQAAYLPTDTLNTVFSDSSKIYHLGSFRGDPEWKKQKNPCGDVESSREQEDYVKHRVHAWYSIIKKNDGKSTGHIEVYIAFRGSHTSTDWECTDWDIVYGSAPFFNERVQDYPSLMDDILDKLSREVRLAYNDKGLEYNSIYTVKMYSTGHSLGGFLALMLSYHSLSNIVRETTKGPKLQGTPGNSGTITLRTNIGDGNRYITPVGFNPFCAYNKRTEDCLKIIPQGYVYRVGPDNKSNPHDAVLHHDKASQIFTKLLVESGTLGLEVNVIQPGYMSPRVVHEKQSLEAYHIMYQFLGQLWCQLQLAGSRKSNYMYSTDLYIRKEFKEPGVLGHYTDDFEYIVISVRYDAKSTPKYSIVKDIRNGAAITPYLKSAAVAKSAAKGGKHTLKQNRKIVKYNRNAKHSTRKYARRRV
jgi:hypothetical protein